MKNKSLKYFTGYFLIFYAFLAITTTQIIPFLTDIGYSPSKRSFMFGVGAALSIFIQIAIGYLSDKYQTIKKVLLPSLFIFTAAVAFFYYNNEIQFLYHFLFFSLVQGLHTGLSVFTDSWVMESDDYTRSHYGLVRGFGSLGWIFGTLLVTKIIKDFGYQKIIILALLVLSFLLVLLFFMEDQKENTSQSVDLNFNDIKILFSDKPYVMAVFLIFLFGSITVIDSISIIDKILLLGGNESHVAGRFVLTALVEIPFFFFGKKLLKNYNYFKLLQGSAILYTLSHLIMGFSNSALTIVLMSVLQGVAFSAYLLSNRNLIYDLSPQHMKSTGQLFANAVIAGVAGILVPISVGYITEYLNVNIPLYLAAVFASLCLVIIPKLKKEMKEDA